MMLKTKFALVFCIVLFLLEFRILAVTPWPGESWIKATPESQGMSSSILEQAEKKAKIPIGKAIVIRNGYEVWTYGGEGVYTDQDWWASSNRSFVTTLFGIAIKEGHIHPSNIEKPVSLLDTRVNKSFLLKYLLSYTSCAEPPGSAWQYNCNYYDMIDILEDIYHQPAKDIANSKIIPALGGKNWEFIRRDDDSSEKNDRSIRVVGSCSDVARWGYLWLNKGLWKDKQLVDQWFVEQSIKPMPIPNGNGFAEVNEGWQIHLNTDGTVWPGLPKDSYCAAGRSGGIIYVSPSLNLVIARNGIAPDSDTGWYSRIDEYLLPIIDAVMDNNVYEEKQIKNVSYPNPDWSSATPEECGMSSLKLNEYTTWLNDSLSSKPYAAVIIRNGKLVYEKYGSGATSATKFDVGSIRKPIASSLLGIAIEEGKLNLEDTVYNVWPFIYDNSKNIKDKNITVKQLATASSGWLTSKKPSEEWRYNNAAFTACHAVIGKAYLLENDQVAPMVESRIKNIIKANDWEVYHYPEDFSEHNGNPGPKLAVNSNAKDLAKYGYLWLHYGNWDGKQVFPEFYAEEASKNQVGALGGHYGYLWQINDLKKMLPDGASDAFFHHGNGRDNERTILYVSRSQDLVAVINTFKEAYDFSEGAKNAPAKKINDWITNITKAIVTANEIK